MLGCGGEKINFSMGSGEHKISGENKAERGGWEVGGDWRRPSGDGAEPGEAVTVDERAIPSRQRDQAQRVRAQRHRAEGIFDVAKTGWQVTEENE